jgi:hypothetical protein
MRLMKANDVVTRAMKHPQKTIFWPAPEDWSTFGSAITKISTVT